MLRDVKHEVKDKNLGFATATGDGRHLKIGVSPVVSDTPIVVTGAMDAAQIKSRLGLSPLADAVMDSVQFGANRIYCLPVSATTAGELGEVTRTGDGGGTMTVDGSPTNAFSVVVKITAQGGLNSAAFAVSIDGGSSFTDEITVPVTGGTKRGIIAPPMVALFADSVATMPSGHPFPNSSARFDMFFAVT